MYTPTDHTESNKSYAPSQGNPTDARAYFYDGSDDIKKQRIYQSVSEVLSEITGIDRQGHVFFVVNTGGTISNGFLSGGTNELYYFKDGYEDKHLVKVIPVTVLDWNSNSWINKPQIPAAQVNSDWNATTGVAQILNKPQIPAAQVNSDWNATTGAAQILNKPTIPSVPVYTSDNAIEKTGTNFQWGGALTKDTQVTGGFRVAFMNGRIGIGMNPVFPLDITNNWANLGAQITNQLSLTNGQARIGLLSAMQIFGGAFTHTSVDQVSGKTGQLVFYNSGAHVLNQGSNYTGQAGILIGYATGNVSGGVPSCFAAISQFGKNANYTEAAGVRVSMPVGSNFLDAANFTGTIDNFYAYLVEAFNPATFPTGTITNIWGFYQKGSEPNRFGGKIVFAATFAATAGNVTINQPAGSVNIAAGQTTVVVTNNMVTANSIVMVQLGTVDNTAKSAVAVEANGAFTITLNAAASAQVKVKFIVYN
jgi:hypothetical protein